MSDKQDIPRRLRQRPRIRGIVVPYVVTTLGDGTADFRASDAKRWLICIKSRLCSLCGQTLDELWFIGGPRCAEHRLFQDPAMHRECAEYALRVCPFLAMPKGHYSDLERRPPPPGFAEIPVLNERPDRFMLGRTNGYQMQPVEGVPFIQAHPWTELHWWKDGVPC